MKRGRVLALLLAVLLFSAAIMPGYAAESRANAQIATTDTSMSKKSNGSLEILFSLQCRSQMDVLGASSIVIQRLSGSSWVSEYTFNIRDYPAMQTQNKSSYTATVSYSPRYSGTSYRAMVFFYARNSEGTGTTIKTTNAV